MEYAARLNKTANCNNFNETLSFFAKNMLHKSDKEAKKFFRDFGEYMEEYGFPCYKIVLNPFLGYSDSFSIIFKSEENECDSWIQIRVFPSGILRIHNSRLSEMETKHGILGIPRNFLDNLNAKVFRAQLRLSGLKKGKNNSVVLSKYVDYRKKDEPITLKGSYEEIFERYTTMNDTLKYCNGYYYEFESKEVKKSYNMFVEMFDGNYFLENAVKRGVLID